MELNELAYPWFEQNAVKTIARDCIVLGIHPKMQVALKEFPDFDKASINDLATEKHDYNWQA